MNRHAYASMFGPTKGDRVRLGDTALMIEVEKLAKEKVIRAKKLEKEQKKQALDELWEDLQSAIQFTRDRNNSRRRQKRLDKKSNP